MRYLVPIIAVSALLFSSAAQDADPVEETQKAVAEASEKAAADTPVPEKNEWEVKINANFMLSFQYYTKNWDGEEQGAITWTAQVNAEFAKQLSSILHNRNIVKLAYGQTQIQNEARNEFGDAVKSTDLIDLESVFRFTLDGYFDPFVSLRLVSQFYDEGDELLLEDDYYFNPVTLTESFGAAATIVDAEPTKWDVRLGGAIRQTLNQRDGIDNTNDGGVELVTEFSTANADGWLTFNSLLKAYEAVFSSIDDTVDPDENWRYPDISWENTLTINLTKYIMLNLYTQLLYDKEIDDDPRFKNTTSLGLTYTFSTVSEK